MTDVGDDRGSGLPAEGEDDTHAATAAGLDEELLQEGAGVPFAVALDGGDPGAPDETYGAGRGASGEGPVTARQSAAGSDVRVEELRDRGADDEQERDEPPLGGPTPSHDAA
jgi:hypothetical protein